MCGTFKASNLDPGGFAEYVRVPGAQRRATPPSRSPRTSATRRRPSWSRWRAVFARCGVRAVQPGDTAVVVGLGSIGRLFVPLFRLAGASVVAVDGGGARRVAFAERRGVWRRSILTGASGLVDKLSDGRGADVVLTRGRGEGARVGGFARP